MEYDDLIDELLDDAEPPKERDSHVPPGGHVPPGDAPNSATQHRDRLAALASGGQAERYLGKNVTAEGIDAMSDEDIEKLYSRYEARLGAQMTQTLGKAALRFYSVVASTVLPIPPENKPKLVADLEADPFVDHALLRASCDLYHRFGMYLAPLTMALTTAKYCLFGHKCPRNPSYEDESNERAGDERAGDEPCC